MNFLSPGQGDRLLARGRVTKPGRTVTVCTGDVFAVSAGHEKLVATMLVTMMTGGGPRDVSASSMSGVKETTRLRMKHGLASIVSQ